MQGQRQLQADEYLDAIRSFNIAVASKDDGFAAYFLRGIAKYSLGDYRGAVKRFYKKLLLFIPFTEEPTSTEVYPTTDC